ncbi:MAG: hypothetical protein OXQ29_09125 [Rhodospirillaceae bacterium]|nr:hypothetical protein [Rhodospirillaceae bacterium]
MPQNTDTNWILGTLIAIATLLAGQIGCFQRELDVRINAVTEAVNGVNTRLTEVSDSLGARIDDVHDRFGTSENLVNVSAASVERVIQALQDSLSARDERLQERIQNLSASIARDIERLAATDDVRAVNTTLLLLTQCLIDVEGPLTVFVTRAQALGAAGGDPPRMPSPENTLSLPSVCRDAHERAARAVP